MARDAVCLSSLVLADVLEECDTVTCLLRSSRNQTCSLNYWYLPCLPSENLIPLVGAIWYESYLESKAQRPADIIRAHMKFFFKELGRL